MSAGGSAVTTPTPPETGSHDDGRAWWATGLPAPSPAPSGSAPSPPPESGRAGREKPAATLEETPSRLPPPLADDAEARSRRVLDIARKAALVVVGPAALLAVNAGVPFYGPAVLAFLAIALGAIAFWSRAVASITLGALAIPGLVVHGGIVGGWAAGFAAYAVGGVFAARRDEDHLASVALTLAAAALVWTPLFGLAPLVLGLLLAYGPERAIGRVAVAVPLVLILLFFAGAASYPSTGPLVWGEFDHAIPGRGAPGRPAEAFSFLAEPPTVDLTNFASNVYLRELVVAISVALVASTIGGAALATLLASRLPDVQGVRASRVARVPLLLVGAAVGASLVAVLLSRPEVPITTSTGLAVGALWIGVVLAGGAHAGVAFALERDRLAIDVQRRIEETARRIDASLARAEAEFAEAQRLIPSIQLAEHARGLQRVSTGLTSHYRPVGRLGLAEARQRLVAIEALEPDLANVRDAGLGKFRREVLRIRESLTRFDREAEVLGIPGVALGSATLDPPDSLAGLDFEVLKARMSEYRTRLLAASAPLLHRARFVTAFVRARISPTFGSAVMTYGRDQDETAPDESIAVSLQHLKHCDERFLEIAKKVEAVLVDSADRFRFAHDEVRALLGRELPEEEAALLEEARSHANEIVALATSASQYPIRHVYQMEGRPTILDEAPLPFGLVRLRLILQAARAAAEERSHVNVLGPKESPFVRLPEIPAWRQALRDDMRILLDEDTGQGFLTRLRTELEDLDRELQQIALIVDRQQLDLTAPVVEATIGRLLAANSRVTNADLPVRENARAPYLQRYADQHPGDVVFDPVKGLARKVTP